MTKIHKYSIPIAKDSFTILMPYHAKILKLTLQEGTPVIWASFNIDEKLVIRKFQTIGTGREFNMLDLTYIGTYANVGFIWHIFEEV